MLKVEFLSEIVNFYCNVSFFTHPSTSVPVNSSKQLKERGDEIHVRSVEWAGGDNWRCAILPFCLEF